MVPTDEMDTELPTGVLDALRPRVIVLEVLFLVEHRQLHIRTRLYFNLDAVHLRQLAGDLVRYLIGTHLGSKQWLRVNTRFHRYVVTLSPDLQSTTREGRKKADSEILVAQLLEIAQFVISVKEEISTASICAKQERLTHLVLYNHFEDDVCHRA